MFVLLFSHLIGFLIIFSCFFSAQTQTNADGNRRTQGNGKFYDNFSVREDYKM